MLCVSLHNSFIVIRANVPSIHMLCIRAESKICKKGTCKAPKGVLEMPDVQGMYEILHICLDGGSGGNVDMTRFMQVPQLAIGCFMLTRFEYTIHVYAYRIACLFGGFACLFTSHNGW